MDRDTYVKKLKAQLDEWNADIDALEAKARQADAKVKVRYEEQIGGLREKQKAARTHLEKVKQANENAWEDLKEGADQAWDSLREAFKKAKSHF